MFHRILESKDKEKDNFRSVVYRTRTTSGPPSQSSPRPFIYGSNICNAAHMYARKRGEERGEKEKKVKRPKNDGQGNIKWKIHKQKIRKGKSRN